MFKRVEKVGKLPKDRSGLKNDNLTKSQNLTVAKPPANAYEMQKVKVT